MGRKPRILAKSGVYHVINRGNNKMPIFRCASDKKYFLKKMIIYANQLDIEIYGYCLMKNHFHLVIGKATPNVSLFIQKLLISYTYFFNRKYCRCGHLFQDRFKSEPVEDDMYFMTLIRYVHQNPEKARICKTDEYQWSSYIEYFKKDTYILKSKAIQIIGGLIEFKKFVLTPDLTQYMDYN